MGPWDGPQKIDGSMVLGMGPWACDWFARAMGLWAIRWVPGSLGWVPSSLG